ncbi:ATP-dependent DNA helicase [Cellulomonas sp. NTE-D12]|uniref:ATP-dependent helicase n=1 Tax=Cellulomonas sp. NTE-D12 TaxID=2962632 RepID=UPI0032B41292
MPDSPSAPPVLRAPADVGRSGARGTSGTAAGRSSTSAAGPVLARPTLADVPQDGPGRPVTLDDAQRAAVEAVAGGERALLVLGAPGTGKTTVALEAVVEAARRGARADDVLVLAASRRLAGDLRDRLAARWPHTAGRPLVQTPAAVAFAVLRARAVALGEPPPALVSGAEQDLVLAELLAGHAEGDGAEVGWPADVPVEALGRRAFRDELRDLLMRAAERGLAPEELAALGRRHERPEWCAAARVYEEYLAVMALRTSTPDVGALLDPAVVVDEAVRALESWAEEVPRVPRPRWGLVVVDDHQESTAATARLLRVLAEDGARLLLLADPDAAVQTFRGADPALVSRAAVAGHGPGELDARVLALTTAWRQGSVLRAVTARVAERVGTVGTAQHRRAAAPPAAPIGSVRVAVLPSEAQEAALVAHALRSARLEEGLGWDRMAVVARSGDGVTRLRRALAAAGVPVSVLGSQVALRDEPAVRPLLDAMGIACGVTSLDAPLAARLLCSPLIGLDAVGLRRVRRALRAVELAGGGGRSSDALLVEAAAEQTRTAGLPPTAARPLRRLASVLAAGRDAALRDGADAQGVLWAVWDAAHVAEAWRRAALSGGASGQRADRDLDAVLALFRAAETFVDRNPQAPPGAFVTWLEGQDLPVDSLAARARRQAVSVLTPAGAAGREWDVVAVTGVQEGVWPDLRLRDSMLGAAALVDLLDGRAGASDGRGDPVQARAAVLADELRSFTVACSRARRRLLVTAVADTDQQPSPFLDLVQPPESEDGAERRTTAPAPLDLRGLVASLRSSLVASIADGHPDRAAARTLARLAAAGVEGADPAEWSGLARPSSDAPLWDEDTRVPVSPSRIEAAQRCTLRWALESAGGTPADSGQQTLGTLVHAIAQELPRGTRTELREALDRRWSELGLGDGWPARAARRRAEQMVDRLADYVQTAGEPLLVEAEFTLTTERALVRGSADRVERAADGAVRVIDLKTGRTPPPQSEAEANPQLAAYQLAVESGAFEQLAAGTSSADARLVYLGSGKKAAQRVQPPIGPEADGPSWARTMIDEVAGAMAAARFPATHNAMCDRCPVRRSCPLRDEGQQVVAG